MPTKPWIILTDSEKLDALRDGIDHLSNQLTKVTDQLVYLRFALDGLGAQMRFPDEPQLD